MDGRCGVTTTRSISPVGSWSILPQRLVHHRRLRSELHSGYARAWYSPLIHPSRLVIAAFGSDHQDGGLQVYVLCRPRPFLG